MYSHMYNFDIKIMHKIHTQYLLFHRNRNCTRNRCFTLNDIRLHYGAFTVRLLMVFYDGVIYGVNNLMVNNYTQCLYTNQCWLKEVILQFVIIYYIFNQSLKRQLFLFRLITFIELEFVFR